MASGRRTLVAAGVTDIVAASNGDELLEYVRAGLEDASHAGSGTAPALVGALPFDLRQPPHLFRPSRLFDLRWRHQATPVAARRPSAAAPIRYRSITADPPPATYAESVRRALALIDSEIGLRKIVLARSVVAHADRSIDPVDVLRRLRADPSITAYAVALPSLDGRPRTLVGATPELLVSKTGHSVHSMPLAGSARRTSGSADRDAADALLRSDKDRREHAIVVEWIADHLAPFCAELHVPATPALVSTQTMWHLGTRITGRLHRAQTSALELALALHPTPAVSGLPQPLASAAIHSLESVDRGFFAGAVGWCDAAGDGEWYVAIRCAEIVGTTARLFAGAGVVAGSDPDAEVAETGGKFLASLHALGIDIDTI